MSDVVRFGGVSLPKTTFGVALNETGSPSAGENGILGMGYTALQYGDQRGYTYPTILDRLYTLGQIQRHAFSLYLNDRNAGKGSILFRGIDSEKYTGDLTALPIIMDDYYGNQSVVEYGVALTSISIDTDAGNSSALSNSSFSQNAILDSGTTGMVLPFDVAHAISEGLGAKEVKLGSQIFNVTPCSYRNSNTSIAFQFGGTSGPVVRVPFSELFLDLGTFGDGDEACWTQIEAAGPHNTLGLVMIRTTIRLLLRRLNLTHLPATSKSYRPVQAFQASAPLQQLPRQRFRGSPH